MPIYEFRCESCCKEYSEYMLISDYVSDMVIKCECGENAERLMGEPLGFVRHDPTTLGQLGERNFKALGKIRGEEMKRENRESNKLARSEAKIQSKKNRKLAKLTPEQKERYIYTGKLPP